jgi:hypothetical protein
MEMRGQHQPQAPEPPGKNPGTNRIGVLLSPTAGTDFSEKRKKPLLLLDSNAELSNAFYNFVAFPLPAI